jgi:protein LTV1
MGKSKSAKPYIDKKNASTYHLLHRSQRDVAGDVLEEGDTSAAGMVLWPSPENNKQTDEKVLISEGQSNKMSEWRQKLESLGLLDEDPDKYLKPITGTGTFLDSNGHVGNALAHSRSKPLEEDGLLEVNRQFDSIPLSAELMDEEIAAALYGDFDESDMEQLNDDFVLDAAKEPEGEEAGSFDYDEHIRALMEKARREREDVVSLPQKHVGNNDQDFFAKLKPLAENDEDDNESFADIGSYYAEATIATTPGVVSALNPDEERALCEKFEEALLEYDSDEMGDCPEYEIHGTRELEGDAQVEAALDDFLLDKEDEIFMQGNRYREKKVGGSGFSALVGKQMVPASALEGLPIGCTESVEETLRTARETLAQPLQKPPTEEILIDGKSYFSERVRNPWDCESILSTYSNMDNNPVTIEATRRRKKKKNKAYSPQTAPGEEIRLSTKTGLPISSRIDEDEDVDESIMSVNRGIARQKGESAEEKRCRKNAIKREREMARIQKKKTREIFQEEFQKRSIDVMSDDIAGKSVFRYA